MDAAADDAAALADVAERLGHEGADRREDDRGVERLGRRRSRILGRGAAERQGEGLRRGVAGTGEGVDAAALPDGDLGEDVGGGAEAVEAERLAPRRPA